MGCQNVNHWTAKLGKISCEPMLSVLEVWQVITLCPFALSLENQTIQNAPSSL